MARNDIQVNIRIPADLKTKVEAAAQESGRSITAEVVVRLEASFLPDEERRSQVDAFMALTRKLEELIESSEALKALSVPASDQSAAHKKPRARRG